MIAPSVPHGKPYALPQVSAGRRRGVSLRVACQKLMNRPALPTLTEARSAGAHIRWANCPFMAPPTNVKMPAYISVGLPDRE